MASTSGRPFFSRCSEAHDHVRHLDPGVVDVVLDPDLEGPVAENPDEGVAQAGVAEVADVGRLVGIDAGVLDDDPTAGVEGGGRGEEPVELPDEGASVEEQVDVPPAGDLGALHSRSVPQLRGELAGDLPGLAAQCLGEIEGRGQRQVSQLDPWRVLERDRLEGDVEGGPRGFTNRAGKALLNIQDHNL